MDDRSPTPERLRRLASRYEAGIGRGRAEQIAGAAIARAQRPSTMPRRVAVAVSSAAFLVVSVTGIGLAADRAVPGDALYAVDRAFESLGFRGDLVEERLEEAIALADRGDAAGAATTAGEALDEINRRGVAVPTVPVTSAPVETTTTAAIDASDSAAPTGDAATTAVAEVPAEEVVDGADAIRLAAEALLQSVRLAKENPDSAGDVEVAAIQLADATALVVPGPTTTTTSSTSSSTSSTSTTTTTLRAEAPAGNGNGNGNGRGNGNGNGGGDNGTTTTTVAPDPDDGSGSEPPGDGGDGSTGPLILPTP